MIHSEDMYKAARKMEYAADKAAMAAEQMEQAAQRIASLLEDGYGGNRLKLIELLQSQQAK